MKFEIQKIQSQVIALPMDNKPALVSYYEKPRIKQYPEPIKKANIFSFVDWCLNLLAVNDTGKEQHHAACFLFITEKLTNFTFEEMREAMLMYVAGEFEIKVMQQFNSVVLGNVMREYKKYRDVSISWYFQERSKYLSGLTEPQMTDEEKNKLVLGGILNCFEEYRKTKTIISGYSWVYDHFNENNMLHFTVEEKRKSMDSAKKILASQARKLDPKDARKVLEDIEAKNSPKVIVKAKSLLLQKFFDDIILHNKDIKKIANETI